LDSLLSYQKKLHEVINQFGEQSPELVIRSISELHRLEISLHTLLKELPDDIATSKDKYDEEQNPPKPWQLDPTNPWSDNYQGNSTANANATATNTSVLTDRQEGEQKPNHTIDIQSQIIEKSQEEEGDTIDIDILGRQFKPFDVVEWIEYTQQSCNKWLRIRIYWINISENIIILLVPHN
jgi:hypothetical protein